MERSSLLYRIRRKIQTIANKWFSDEVLSKFYFRIVLKKKLNLANPQTFNEKLQWLKLKHFPRNPLVIQCTDKYEVRAFLIEEGYSDKLVPLLGVWDQTDDINWSQLPDRFVFKCNHGCAYNIVCTDKSKLDIKATKKCLDIWMAEDFGAFNIEPHYSEIKHHRIICEEYLGCNIVDYKFFCFNGDPKYIYVSTDLIHDRQAQIGFFYLDGTKMPLKRDDYTDISSIKLPHFYEEMKTMAKTLAKHFVFVRVDFFLANNTFYFAELTFTPGACMIPFNPDYFDSAWGKEIDIECVRK